MEKNGISIRARIESPEALTLKEHAKEHIDALLAAVRTQFPTIPQVSCTVIYQDPREDGFEICLDLQDICAPDSEDYSGTWKSLPLLHTVAAFLTGVNACVLGIIRSDDYDITRVCLQTTALRPALGWNLFDLVTSKFRDLDTLWPDFDRPLYCDFTHHYMVTPVSGDDLALITLMHRDYDQEGVFSPLIKPTLRVVISIIKMVRVWGSSHSEIQKFVDSISLP